MSGQRTDEAGLHLGSGICDLSKVFVLTQEAAISTTQPAAAYVLRRALIEKAEAKAIAMINDFVEIENEGAAEIDADGEASDTADVEVEISRKREEFVRMKNQRR